MRSIPDPGFAGDTGAVDPRLAAALAAYRGASGGGSGSAPGTGPGGEYAAVLAALQAARLLVPVVAVLGEVEHDAGGLAREKTSEMASVLMRGRDGRLALLAFTGTGPLAAWDPQARPVPVTARQAARAALQEGAAALVVDVAGPVLLVVEEPDLRPLADGYTLTSVGGRAAWVRPAGGPDGREPAPGEGPDAGAGETAGE